MSKINNSLGVMHNIMRTMILDQDDVISRYHILVHFPMDVQPPWKRPCVRQSTSFGQVLAKDEDVTFSDTLGMISSVT